MREATWKLGEPGPICVREVASPSYCLACSVYRAVVTTGFARPNLLRFSHCVQCGRFCNWHRITKNSRPKNSWFFFLCNGKWKHSSNNCSNNCAKNKLVLKSPYEQPLVEAWVFDLKKSGGRKKRHTLHVKSHVACSWSTGASAGDCMFECPFVARRTTKGQVWIPVTGGKGRVKMFFGWPSMGAPAQAPVFPVSCSLGLGCVSLCYP